MTQILQNHPNPVTLKKRRDFVRIQASSYVFSSKSFVVKVEFPAAPTEAAEPRTRSRVERGMTGFGDGLNYGLTVTKKMGNAVTRNKIRRRLRAAFKEALKEFPLPPLSLVILARQNALVADYKDLRGELNHVLEKVQRVAQRLAKPIAPSL